MKASQNRKSGRWAMRRLGQEDERQGESNCTIRNQRLLLAAVRPGKRVSEHPVPGGMTDTRGPTSSGPRGRRSWR